MTISEVQLENEVENVWNYCSSCSEAIDENSNGFSWTEDTDEIYCNYCSRDHLYWSDENEAWYRFSSNMPENREDEYQEEDNPDHRLNQWKPIPIFYGASLENTFLGIELEVELQDFSNSRIDLVNELNEHNWLNENKGLWYFHRDGSLDDGIEFVSHPFSFDFAKNNLDLSWLKKLADYGLRSWDTKTCGIHCHISREGFLSDTHVFAFAKLFYNNPRQFIKLAGRESKDFASFDPEYRGELVPQIKKKHDLRRYVAVNLTNEKTIEVRIFKGSLNETRVRSAIELVFAVHEYTKNLTIQDMNNGALKFDFFGSFLIENAAKYPNTNHYLTKFNLVKGA